MFARARPVADRSSVESSSMLLRSSSSRAAIFSRKSSGSSTSGFCAMIFCSSSSCSCVTGGRSVRIFFTALATLIPTSTRTMMSTPTTFVIVSMRATQGISNSSACLRLAMAYRKSGSGRRRRQQRHAYRRRHRAEEALEHRQVDRAAAGGGQLRDCGGFERVGLLRPSGGVVVGAESVVADEEDDLGVADLPHFLEKGLVGGIGDDDFRRRTDLGLL